ncbi:RNA pyrophosphohydrolase [Paracoccus sp. M683]|uniref:RNA pyrophosphohydrolase n=1 Tax=Paracoccus sp. M683 TaxID=2594268 RepID=UPI001180D82C|nr:RNA pyrophosphohydrolase [Paracoccus sp. M683]TRW95044.1 RNA pyrophosphohydrolase [Paracoccus sp. M683]
MSPADIPVRQGPGGLPYRPCAGVVLVNRDGLVFAGRRIDNPGHAWQMPQGGIDKGETPRDAALRELVEETGVSPDLVTVESETADWVTYDLPPELLGKVWKGKYGGQIQKWFLLRFNGRDTDVRIDTDHPEFSEWCWQPAADLTAGIVAFKRGVYEQVFAEFGDRLKTG